MAKILKAQWQNWDGKSIEDLTIMNTEQGWLCSSIIRNTGENYSARYVILCDLNWRVKKLEIELRGNQQKLELEADGLGRWTERLKVRRDLDGAIDVDISATPFTNSIPIRRLRLIEHQTEDIIVVYISVPGLKAALRKQRYTCLVSGKRYRFEEPGTGLVRDIETDKNGLVLEYPGFFRRILSER